MAINSINGTTGNDTLGLVGTTAGIDYVNGANGNDTLVYDRSLMNGNDRYFGGRGIDTVEFRFTAAQWTAATQTLITNFKTAVDAASSNGTVEVAGAIGTPLNLGLGRSLLVSSIEKVRVYVDNVLVLGDPPPSTTGSVKEAGVDSFTTGFAPIAGTASATGLMPDTDNGGVPIPAGSTWSIGSAPGNLASFGTMAINPTTGQWTFNLNNSLATVQDLQAGDVVTLSFIMTATHPSLTNALARNVTITINGTNDAATIAVSGTDFDASERGGLNNAVVGPFGDGASGTLIITNVDENVNPAGLPADAPAGSFQWTGPGSSSVVVAGKYGTLTFAPTGQSGDQTTGTWTYSVNQLAAVVQALTPADVVTDTIALPSNLFDGANHTFNFTVYGADDLPTISIVETLIETPVNNPATIYDGAVREAGEIQNTTDAGDPNASGQFSISDVDNTGPFTFAKLTGTALDKSGNRVDNTSSIGKYGDFTLDTTTGKWTYKLDNNRPATERLEEGQVVTEVLTVVSSTSPLVTNSITVTITGNDDYTKDIVNTYDTEGSEVIDPSPFPLPGGTTDSQASGLLTIVDPDFYPGAPSPYNFPITALGSIPIISGVGTELVAVQGLYGSFFLGTPTIPATGGGSPSPTPYVQAAWLYQLGSLLDPLAKLLDVNALPAGTSTTEVMYVSSNDGGVVGKGIEVTITGTNDIPEMQWSQIDTTPFVPAVPNPPPATLDVMEAGSVATPGSPTGTVSPNSINPDPSVSGTVINEDVDNGEDGWHASNPASQTGKYGSFTFDYLTGNWKYTLDQSKADPLLALEVVTETFSLKTNDFDDISHSITITVTGSNDAATITRNTTPVWDDQVKEAGGVNNGNLFDPNASGDLNISDVDGLGAFNESYFKPLPANNPSRTASEEDLNGKYGDFTFDPNTGAWTYKLDNNLTDTQNLADGVTVTDTLLVYSADNSNSYAITVTITGSFDASTIITAGPLDREVTAEGERRNFLQTTSTPVVADPTAGGTLNSTIGDSFVAVTNAQTKFGQFSIDALGNWTFQLNNEDADTLALISNVNKADVPLVSAQDFFTVSTQGLTGPVATYTIAVDVFGAYTKVDLKGVNYGVLSPNGGADLAAGAAPTVNSNGSITYIARNGDPGETLKVYLGDPTVGTPFQWGTVAVTDSVSSLTQSVVSMPTSPASAIPGVVQGTLFVWDGDTLMNEALNLNLGLSQGTAVSDTFSMATANANGGLASGYAGNDSITGTNGVDYIDGGADNDTILAGASADTVLGGTGADSLNGQGGADQISGGEDNDRLLGGGGNDTLRGDSGRDTLTGGANDDLFVFVQPLSPFANDDTVVDFGNGNDTLWFEASLLTSAGYVINQPGVQANDLADDNIAWFQAGTAATTPDARFVYDNVLGQLFYDVDGNGGAAQVLIATFDPSIPGALDPTFGTGDFQFGTTPPGP